MNQPPADLTSMQRAVITMKEMRRRIETLESRGVEAVAVIGMACRFPGGGDTPEAFWRLLLDGVDAVTEVPAERWDVDAYYHPDPDHYGTMNTRFGSFLSGVDRFDPHFFGMSEHEATSIDPQHRLLVEVAWEALERACIPPKTLEESRTGVYIGITAMEYIHLLNRAEAVNAYYVGGAPLCAAAGRLSHLLGLQGPCMSIDTACSSALVSIHQACQSLRIGESDLALAGGVNLTLTPHGSVFLSRAHMLAPDGRCKTFTADADGFVRGEGCGILVLRRLSDAEAAGDPIHAVILGSAVNHDGPSNGFTAPNGRSQEKLIRQALENARVDPHEVDFVETHGTGTSLGDPIEVEAVGKALCGGRPAEAPLYLGAVKTNIGHLESASGAAGVMKALLAVGNGRIPGNIHRGEPNPYIAWDRLSVEVPGQTLEWPRNRVRRIAGVSAFGATGTNAHVIVAEAPPRLSDEGDQRDRGLHLLALSARSDGALVDLAGRYAEHLVEHPEQSFADVCFSAAIGRDHFEHRLAVVASSAEAAVRRLVGFARGDEVPGLQTGVVQGPFSPSVGLFLAGEPLPPGLLASLMEVPAFLRAYESCRGEHAGSPALDLVAGEFALARMWRAWGVQPARVAGLGAGILAVGIVAGAISSQAGVRLALGVPPEVDELQPPEIPVLSAADGMLAEQDRTGDPGFWTDWETGHDPERLAEGFRREGVALVVTTGEGGLGGEGGSEWVGSRGEDGAWAVLLDSMALLYVRGVGVELAAVDEGYNRRKVVLPTYPFQRTRCWPDLSPSTGADPTFAFGECDPGTPEQGGLGAVPASGVGPLPGEMDRILGRQLEVAGDTLVRLVEEQLAALLGNKSTVGAPAANEEVTSPVVEASAVHPPSTHRRLSMGDWHLLMLAASSEEELERHAHDLADAVAARPELVLEIGTGGPEEMAGAHRRIVAFNDPGDAVAGLTRPDGLPRRTAAGVLHGQPASVSFMLPGLGDHYAGMAEGLYHAAEGFRRRFDRCALLLEPEIGVDLREILFTEGSGAGASASPALDLRQMLGRSQPPGDEGTQRLNEIVHAHSAIFSVEYALAGLWQDWGVSPQGLLGFSLGEFVGATLANVMSLKDGLTLVARRARVIETLPRGAMLAVLLAPEDLGSLLDGELTVAVWCAPNIQVVGGPPQDIARLEARLGERDIVSRRLQSDYAFHTPAMAGQEEPTRELAAGFPLRPPAIPICSNTSGRWLAPDEASDPRYWAQHTVLPVRFGEGVERLLETDHHVIIEIGPGQSLTSFALQSPSMEAVRAVEFVPSLRSRHETDPDVAVFLRSLGRLWLNGIEVSQPGEED